MSVGESKSRRGRFFSEHPVCCFCGGQTPSEEEDHWPPRAFFAERKWPEGFVFPACKRCNDISVDAENAVSLLASAPKTERDQITYRARVEYLREHKPELFERLQMSPLEKRRALKRLGIETPAGTFSGDFPLLRVGAEWDPSVRLCARKLMLALHYMCFGHPLPTDGGLWVYWGTNTDDRAILSPEILKVTEQIAQPIRDQKYLSDQFSVRWNCMNDPEMAIFVVHFQKTLLMSGITSVAPELVGADQEKTLRPFTHDG